MKMITNKQIVVYKFEDTLNSINLDEVWINTKKNDNRENTILEVCLLKEGVWLKGSIFNSLNDMNRILKHLNNCSVAKNYGAFKTFLILLFVYFL